MDPKGPIFQRIFELMGARDGDHLPWRGEELLHGIIIACINYFRVLEGPSIEANAFSLLKYPCRKDLENRPWEGKDEQLRKFFKKLEKRAEDSDWC